MNISKYLEKVDRYAVGEVAENCIQSLFKCFEINNIALSNLPKFNSSVALRRGLPFSYIAEESYSNELFSKSCKFYSENLEFNENDFAEISTIALLIALQATEINPVKRTSDKSHDFDVSWFHGNEIEVEVTRPGEKDAWSKRVSQSQEIVKFAESLNRTYSIDIYVPELLTKEDQTILCDLISDLDENRIIDKEGKWLIIAEKPSGDPYVFFENTIDTKRPKWWPVNSLNGFSMSGMVAGPNQIEPLPRINVKFSCPFGGYINSAKNKAVNFQGTRKKPFLLVLDVNELGSPFNEFKINLEYYFNQWKHISAVIIFINHYDSTEIGWELQLFINPDATRKFDKKTQNILKNYCERNRTIKRYAE